MTGYEYPENPDFRRDLWLAAENWLRGRRRGSQRVLVRALPARASIGYIGMMKTLVITIPDHIEAAIEAKASHTGRAAAELAADMLGSAVGGTDWSDELDDDARASVREGMADIERGAVREHEAVFELLNMKQMTITLSGALSAAVEEKAAYLGRSAADLVAETVAHAFLPDDWLDSLSDEDKAAIEEGRAQIERGEGSPHDEVMERLYRKHGW